MPDNKMAIQGGTLTAIADAVRGLTHDDAAMTPAQMASTVSAQRLGIPFEHHDHMVNGKWVRPEGWPDLDALKAQIPEGETCVYFTYVLSRVDPEQRWVGLWGYGAAWYAERGHVTNGAWVTDESTSHASNQYHREVLDPAKGDVQLWRIRSEGKVTQIGFAAKTATNANNPATLSQPCVERAGKLPHVSNLSSGCSTFNNNAYTVKSMTTFFLERDSIDVGGAVTTCAYMYYFSTSLQEVDTSGWETSKWHPTTLGRMFSDCRVLESLDLTGWDTSGWATTSLDGTFADCFSLVRLKTGWDTSNWRVTSLNGLFASCYSLQDADFGKWDTSGWAVNVLTSTFSGCYSLRALDLTGWDVSAWPMKGSMASFIQNCWSLESIDFTGWDTSGWAPTSSRYVFEGCSMLKSLPLVDFNEPAACSYFGVPNGYLIEDYGGRARIDITHNYRNCVLLTHQSLVNILTALPTVTTNVSVQLGPTNLLKLSDEEIAVATAKGWSVVA